MNNFLGYYDKNSDGSVERMKMRQEHGNDGGSPVVVVDAVVAVVHGFGSPRE